VAVATDTVLTALHVTTGQGPGSLVVGDGRPVLGVASLPTWRFGWSLRQARLCRRRSTALTGVDNATVDLALLDVPGLAVPQAQLSYTAVRTGELIAIAGYPNGRWTATVGPVTSTDDADYVARVLLGPGSSGAPAFDQVGRVCGLVTMDHLTAGSILIGPRLLSAFVEHARPCSWCRQR
jgi:hypothetical protein